MHTGARAQGVGSAKRPKPSDAVQPRAGELCLHSGEVEATGETPGGIAMHIGARVATQAAAGEAFAAR